MFTWSNSYLALLLNLVFVGTQNALWDTVYDLLILALLCYREEGMVKRGFLCHQIIQLTVPLFWRTVDSSLVTLETVNRQDSAVCTLY